MKKTSWHILLAKFDGKKLKYTPRTKILRVREVLFFWHTLMLSPPKKLGLFSFLLLLRTVYPKETPTPKKEKGPVPLVLLRSCSWWLVHSPKVATEKCISPLSPAPFSCGSNKRRWKKKFSVTSTSCQGDSNTLLHPPPSLTQLLSRRKKGIRIRLCCWISATATAAAAAAAHKLRDYARSEEEKSESEREGGLN